MAWSIYNSKLSIILIITKYIQKEVYTPSSSRLLKDQTTIISPPQYRQSVHIFLKFCCQTVWFTYPQKRCRCIENFLYFLKLSPFKIFLTSKFKKDFWKIKVRNNFFCKTYHEIWLSIWWYYLLAVLICTDQKMQWLL